MHAARSRRPPVYLLGGRLNALSAARSLGGRGIEVRVLDHRGEGRLVASSRHCDQYRDSPPGEPTAGWWLDVLRREGAGAVVFPCNDIGLELLARHRPELEDAGCLPIEADGEALLLALDKEATYQRAREVGVPAPSTVRVCTPEDLGEASTTLEFPFAVKPASAHRFWQALQDHADLLGDWLGHPKGLVVDDEKGLRRLTEPLVALGIEVLATEVVVGPDDGYCSYYTYLDEAGQPLFHFTKRKPRQYPIHFGQGTFHVTGWQPDVAELGLALCQGLGLRGICNVEFKRDSRSGQLRVIESNARLTASDALERKAGLDIPHIAYCRAVGEPVSVPATFPDGLCQWLPLGDLRAYRAYREAGELTTGQWLSSLAHPQSFTVFDWSDPGPAAKVASARARAMPRRLTTRARRAVRTAAARAGARPRPPEAAAP